MHNDILKTQSSPERFGRVWLIECIKHEITVRLLGRSTILRSTTDFYVLLLANGSRFAEPKWK